LPSTLLAIWLSMKEVAGFVETVFRPR